MASDIATIITTPESHPIHDYVISESTKKKVQAADPNGGSCLVENNKRAIEYCHCIPRRYMDDDNILDSLEWAWDMRRGTLNLDTRYNIFCVNSSIHHMFDQHQWLLMPEDSVIEKFNESLYRPEGKVFAKRGNFPDFPETETFFYKFVPLQGLELETICRRNFDPDGNPIPVTDILYPFDKLPLLKSHLHPKFAIFDCGRKLASLNLKSYTKLVNTFPDLTSNISSVQSLYTAWIRQPEELENFSFNVPSDDGNEDDYDRTKPGRPHLRTKRRKRLADKPTAVKRKRRRPNNSGLTQKVLSESSTHNNRQLLSEMTLSSLNQQLGDATWSDRICEWSKHLQGKP